MLKVGVIGSGAMGSGIAQVAAQAGCEVVLHDAKTEALQKSKSALAATFPKLVEKGKMSAEDAVAVESRISFSESLTSLSECNLVIEAIIEDLEVKKKVFAEVENVVSADCILATNTSSLSVTAIASSCKKPERVVGIHFFNPAPLMPLVEIIPALQTRTGLVEEVKNQIASWGKVPVIARDTPGFIVNRVARPFYGEALRIYEEGFADFSTIDEAMRSIGFRMGPFELMDLIGNDVNYAVTESVFKSFYYDPRYKPFITQKKMVEAAWLGKKTGRGYYDYSDGAAKPQPSSDEQLKENISWRILAMLINEAHDALYLNIASRDDLELAMTKGVIYPKGLIAWGEEIGLKKCVETMDRLYENYREDRYRCSPLLRKLTA